MPCAWVFILIGFHVYFQLNLHERGMKLDSTLYEVVCEALMDDYECVRMASLKLIDVISHLHSEKLVLIYISLFTKFL